MNREFVRRIAYWVDWVSYYLIMATGTLTVGLALAASALVGIAKIEQAAAYPPVYEGTIVAFSYDDGHTTYSSYTFGDWSITKAHRKDGEAFYIGVSDGEHTDYWEVSREQYSEFQMDEYVTRDDLANEIEKRNELK